MQSQSASWGDFASARYGAPAAMFTLGIALHAFNAFFVSTTMPSAALEFEAVALLSWATSAYLVASIVGGAAAATLKARFGSRAVLMAASATFMAGTLSFGLAQDAGFLIAGRLLQGGGGGVVMACCYMLIPEIFPKALVPRIFALESVAWVLAAIGGPAIAGVVTEMSSWRTAVLMSVPASLAFVAFIPFCVAAHERSESANGALPLRQLALVAVGVLLLSVTSAFAVAAGLALIGAAVALDARSKVRLLPGAAFDAASPVSAGLLVIFLMCLAEASTIVYVAFVGQVLWSLSVVESGFLAAVVAITWSLTAIGVAHMPRLATWMHVVPAPLLLALGLGLFVVALVGGSIVVAVASQILIGGSFGFSWARLCEHIMEVAPDHERDFAAGAIPTIQFAGLSIGAALWGTAAAWFGLEAHQAASGVVTALVPVFAAAAVLAAAATLVARRAA
jgi:MFS family permease